MINNYPSEPDEPLSTEELVEWMKSQNFEIGKKLKAHLRKQMLMMALMMALSIHLGWVLRAIFFA